jgi:hypothetical protein
MKLKCFWVLERFIKNTKSKTGCLPAPKQLRRPLPLEANDVVRCSIYTRLCISLSIAFVRFSSFSDVLFAC